MKNLTSLTKWKKYNVVFFDVFQAHFSTHYQQYLDWDVVPTDYSCISFTVFIYCLATTSKQQWQGKCSVCQNTSTKSSVFLLHPRMINQAEQLHCRAAGVVRHNFHSTVHSAFTMTLFTCNACWIRDALTIFTDLGKGWLLAQELRLHLCRWVPSMLVPNNPSPIYRIYHHADQVDPRGTVVPLLLFKIYCYQSLIYSFNAWNMSSLHYLMAAISYLHFVSFLPRSGP